MPYYWARAPGVVAVGEAYSDEAGYGPSILRVTAAYYNLTLGEAAGLGVNVSLKPLEARSMGEIVGASPRAGWAVPVNGGILAAFSLLAQ